MAFTFSVLNPKTRESKKENVWKICELRKRWNHKYGKGNII